MWRGSLPNRLVSTWVNPFRIIQYISLGIVILTTICWFAGMCVIIGASGQPNPGMVALVCLGVVFMALLLSYMVVVVRSNSRQQVVVDESGITRTGTGGWHVDWRDMERVKLQRPMATTMITVIERPEVSRLRRNWLLNWSYLQPWKSVMSAIEDAHQPVIAAMVAAHGIPVER